MAQERELYELYYKGIPDTYNLDGVLIPGVEPDALKAIHYLGLILNSPEGNEHDFLNLAKIYHYGMHKFPRNLDEAEKIYIDLKHQYVTDATYQTVMDALADIKKIRVYTWLNLPLDEDDNEAPVINPPPTLPILPINPPDPRPLLNITPPNPGVGGGLPNHVLQFDIGHLRPIINDLDEFPDHDAKHYDDPQNTHNPQVLSTIRASLNNLRASTQITRAPEKTVIEIRNYLYSLKDSDKKNSAIRSLHKIEKNLEKLSSTDMNSMEALNLVWNRIHDAQRFDAQTHKNLKENLLMNSPICRNMEILFVQPEYLHILLIH